MKGNTFALVVSGASSLFRFGWWGSSCNVRRSYSAEANGCSRLGAELFRQFIESDLSEVSPLWIKYTLEKWRIDGIVKNYIRAPAVARASHWTNFSIVLNLARLGE